MLQSFTTNTVNEILFVLEEPIVVKKLVLDINAATRPAANNIYYWYLNLFGCLRADGKHSFVKRYVL